ACWMAYPYLEHEWGAPLGAAREAWIELARAIATEAHAALELLAPDKDTAGALEARLEGAPGTRVHVTEYGDAWTRDTAPCFLVDGEGTLGAACFRFDGWGGKYRMPGDDRVGAEIATTVGCRAFGVDLVCEGGALEVDGE